MKLNGKQYDKFILNGKTYEKFYLNNKIYQSLDPGLILDLPLQNNFTDYSASGISMVAGGTSNQPTFALSGRKAGEYCAVFNGSQSIKTTTNLPINSDKVTIAFWMKTTQAAVAIIAELSAVFDSNNAFAAYTNSPANKITIADHTGSTFNRSSGSNTINTSSWIHIAATIDRSLGTNQTKIYINNSLVTVIDIAGDLNGNFINNILFIGQRGGNSLGFNGSLTRLKIYNYPFTPSEVSTLYNSEL